MEETLVSASTIVWLAFAIGAVFGLVAHRTNFCTMGAVSDIVNMGDWNRMRMWALAIAIAILGTGALQWLGLFDASKTLYTGSRLTWLGHLLGGACFGIGMTLASGCGSKTLIRIGGGNLKSIVVFVFLAIGAYMTIRGLFGVWRVSFIEPFATELPHGQDIPAFLAAAGLEPASALLLATAVIGGGLLLWSLASREAWRADVLLGGIVVGATVVAGWYVSGHIGYVAEHPETLTVRREGERLRPCAVGETGQVMVSRYDRSMLVMNMVLEDLATRTPEGILHPHREHRHLEGKLLY